MRTKGIKLNLRINTSHRFLSQIVPHPKWHLFAKCKKPEHCFFCGIHTDSHYAGLKFNDKTCEQCFLEFGDALQYIDSEGRMKY